MLPDTSIDDVKKQRNAEYAKHINDPVLSSLKMEGIRLLFLKVGIFRRQKQKYVSGNTRNMIRPEGGDTICAETKLYLVYNVWVYKTSYSLIQLETSTGTERPGPESDNSSSSNRF
jgi:hypothetical protein